MAENFLYFTELLGLPVYDLKHRRIGRVRDAAIVPLIHPARIDRYLVGAGASWLSVRYDQISNISLDGIQLSNEKLYPYHSDEYMLRLQRDLLDQQIIDVNGRKVVRVTDVSFEVRHDDRDSLMMLEVDVASAASCAGCSRGCAAALDPAYAEAHFTQLDPLGILQHRRGRPAAAPAAEHLERKTRAAAPGRPRGHRRGTGARRARGDHRHDRQRSRRGSALGDRSQDAGEHPGSSRARSRRRHRRGNVARTKPPTPSPNSRKRPPPKSSTRWKPSNYPK